MSTRVMRAECGQARFSHPSVLWWLSACSHYVTPEMIKNS